MTREDIFKTVDHTLLAQTATWEEIKEICDDAIKYQTASVCIPASYVKRAKDYISEALEAMLDLGKGSGPMKHCFNITGKYVTCVNDDSKEEEA